MQWREFTFTSPATPFQTNYNTIREQLGAEYAVAYAVRPPQGVREAMEWKHQIDAACGDVGNALIGQVTDPTPAPGNDVTRSLGLPPGYGFPRFVINADGVTMTTAEYSRKIRTVLMTLPAPAYVRR